jgi:TetR/AcrR family acrAB operon transcriptional repressor
MYTPDMPRRTKEDALATREGLLDAAERVFQAQGVSATSLADIAGEAGTTRGAIYWHFKDKADLFNAMMERVVLPLEDAFRHVSEDPDPLASLRQAVFAALDRTATDGQTRRVLEVATLKVEYVDSLGPVRTRHLRVRGDFTARMKEALRRAERGQNARLAMSAEHAAQGLHSLLGGLIHDWLLDPAAFDLPTVGRQAVDSYLRGLGLTGLPSAR